MAPPRAVRESRRPLPLGNIGHSRFDHRGEIAVAGERIIEVTTQLGDQGRRLVGQRYEAVFEHSANEIAGVAARLTAQAHLVILNAKPFDLFGIAGNVIPGDGAQRTDGR